MRLPEKTHNHLGEERKVGIEIEFAGLSPRQALEALTCLYGGTEDEHHLFHYVLSNTSLGDFILELDSSQLQSLGENIRDLDLQRFPEALESVGLPLLSKAAESLVPWEIVTSPIPMHRLHELLPLIERLRELGALGTRHAMHYAFGLHINFDLPDLSAETILNYLRAYLCLYDWVSSREKVDWVRKLSPYIRHFSHDYIKHVLHVAYQPTMTQLIDDYLRFNPTRNRSLDLLPLFAFIDESRVKAIVDDPRVKKRPTFHYRLPNCDIDNPEWNLDFSWNLWLQVEKLAWDGKELDLMCAAYLKELKRFTTRVDGNWLNILNNKLPDDEA